MKITSLRIRNFRTLEDVHLDFPSSYAAICGPNDSGKTNVVRAVRALMKEESPFQMISFEREEEEVTLKDDYPKWKDTPSAERRIEFEITVEVDSDRDTGFYQFLTKQLTLEEPADTLALTIQIVYGERPEPAVTVTCTGNTYDGIEAQQVLNKLQTSRSLWSNCRGGKAKQLVA